jgi:hypothetical protein
VRISRSVPVAAWIGLSGLVACSGAFTGASGNDGGGTVTEPSATAGPDGSVGPDGSSGRLRLVDDTAEHFRGGTFVDAAYVDGRVRLVDRTRGRFVSRVHDAGAEVRFVAMGFVPGAAYRKHLPRDGGRESGYPSFSADMTGAEVVLDFDGAVGQPIAAGARLADGSGKAHVGTAKGSGESYAAGPWGSALRDVGSGYVAVAAGTGAAFDLASDDATWALWVKTQQGCPGTNPPSGNRVYFGMEEGGSDRTHMWLGCSVTTTPACAGPAGRLGGTWCSRREPNDDCANYCGTAAINDGAWHHLAIVKRGHGQARLRTFVDGVQDGPEVSATFAAPFTVAGGSELAVGAFSGGSFQAEGDFDEVLAFRRALGDAEIRGIYTRSAVGLALRVRTCNDAACSGDPPFVGPEGGAGPFVDPDGANAPPSSLALTLPRARYVQYEVTFDALTTRVSPELFSVVIEAER